jgi:hypothetical protein
MRTPVPSIHPGKKTRKIFKVVGIFLAIETGLYPVIYLVVDRKFGLLASKSESVLTNLYWNIGFYMHIFLGGLALLIGWMQFNARLRNRNLKWHKRIGSIYIVSALLSSMAAFYIAFYAKGGVIASLGFMSLAIIWFGATLRAYAAILQKKIAAHQKMMIYSYAACFAAVTLRIYLPLLNILLRDEIKAYLVVSWLCWVPNIIFAFFLVKRLPPVKEEKVAYEKISAEPAGN